MARTASSYSFTTAVLRRHVGLGRRFSVKAVARATNYCHRTVKAWLTGETEPPPRKLFALADLLGPAFVNDLLAELGYGGAFQIGGAAPQADEHAALMAKALTELLEAKADHHFDSSERARLASIYRRVSSESAHFAHTLEKAA